MKEETAVLIAIGLLQAACIGLIIFVIYAYPSALPNL